MAEEEVDMVDGQLGIILAIIMINMIMNSRIVNISLEKIYYLLNFGVKVD